MFLRNIPGASLRQKELTILRRNPDFPSRSAQVQRLRLNVPLTTSAKLSALPCSSVQTQDHVSHSCAETGRTAKQSLHLLCAPPQPLALETKQAEDFQVCCKHVPKQPLKNSAFGLKAPYHTLTRWLCWLEHHPLHQNVVGSIPGQGTHLGFQFDPLLGRIREATNQCFSLSLLLSLKSINISSDED